MEVHCQGSQVGNQRVYSKRSQLFILYPVMRPVCEQNVEGEGPGTIMRDFRVHCCSLSQLVQDTQWPSMWIAPKSASHKARVKNTLFGGLCLLFRPLSQKARAYRYIHMSQDERLWRSDLNLERNHDAYGRHAVSSLSRWCCVRCFHFTRSLQCTLF